MEWEEFVEEELRGIIPDNEQRRAEEEKKM